MKFPDCPFSAGITGCFLPWLIHLHNLLFSLCAMILVLFCAIKQSGAVAVYSGTGRVMADPEGERSSEIRGFPLCGVHQGCCPRTLQPFEKACSKTLFLNNSIRSVITFPHAYDGQTTKRTPAVVVAGVSFVFFKQKRRTNQTFNFFQLHHFQNTRAVIPLHNHKKKIKQRCGNGSQ